MKRLVLLGGGHAHVHVLRELARAPLPGTEVLLVTPFERQLYSGMVPGLVAGHYTLEQCVIPLVPLAQAAGVRWLQGSADGLDAAARTVHLAGGQQAEFDLLSIDTGSVMERDLVPGAREHALFVRPMEHFVALLDRLWALAAQQPLNLAVVGGGAAGVELALAFQHRLGEAARVSLVTGGLPPLAGYPAPVMARAAAVLRRRRITVLPDACRAIEPGQVLLGSGARLACDVPVLAIGSSAPRWLAGSGLALCERGFVLTGPTLQSTSHPAVLAAGDVATRSDVAHPRSGVYAVRAGPPLAANLRALVAGTPPQPHVPQQRTLNLVSCGRKEAIASWGPHSAQGRWVWWWKDHIDRAFVDRYRQRPG